MEKISIYEVISIIISSSTFLLGMIGFLYQIFWNYKTDKQTTKNETKIDEFQSKYQQILENGLLEVSKSIDNLSKKFDKEIKEPIELEEERKQEIILNDYYDDLIKAM